MDASKENPPAERILIVEDSKLFVKILKKEISQRLPFTIDVAESFAEARLLIERHKADYYLSLLDLNLPDAPNGEVVDYVRGEGIPAIVFTGEFDDELRERMSAQRVIDYVLKESPSSLEFLLNLLERLHRNEKTRIMVVDDSTSARTYMKRLLELHRFCVVEAKDGQDALEKLAKNRDISVVLTDFNMPVMDGFELTKRIRIKHKRNDMAVIGISSQGNNHLSARFIKNGANDFITKPFLEEEFFCRLNQNIENLEYIQALRDVAIRDFLTGMHNRRYLFDTGEQLFAGSKRGQVRLAAAMVDVDFFKKVNDTYGHDAGDEVLKAMGRLLKERFRTTDVVARMGGEEFCILMVNMDPESLQTTMEALREAIEGMEIVCGEQRLRITASIGVSYAETNTLDELINLADAGLYKAKTGGRNQVVIH